MSDKLPNAAMWEITAPDRWAETTTIRQRVGELVKQHGGLRKAARAVGMTPQYLYRLGNGEKKNASTAMLRKIGLRRVVTYLRSPSTTGRPEERK